MLVVNLVLKTIAYAQVFAAQLPGQAEPVIGPCYLRQCDLKVPSSASERRVRD